MATVEPIQMLPHMDATILHGHPDMVRIQRMHREMLRSMLIPAHMLTDPEHVTASEHGLTARSGGKQ